MNFDIDKHIIFEVLSGSHAYGLANPESDFDYRGVAIPPMKFFLGTTGFEQHVTTKEADRTIYDIRKFVKLAADCNPNIIELLWMPARCIKTITPVGQKLLDSRELFLSKKAKHTYSGYAIAQLKRIKTHKRWLLNPLDRKPIRAEFGLPDTSLVPADIQGAISSLEAKGLDVSNTFSSEVMTIYQRERQYHNALREWQQYEDWKKTRNEKRAALEAKFGYDTKHAMHLVRLMRMCREILTSGEVLVERPDKDELLAIRNGAWSYGDLVAWATIQDLELEKLYKTTTVLPHTPNTKKIDALCIELVESFHGIRYEKAAL